MKVSELRNIIKDLSNDVEVEINAVWDEELQDLIPVGCDGFYHEKDNKVYLTPDVISI